MRFAFRSRLSGVNLCKVLLQMLKKAAAFLALNTNLSTAVIEQTTTRFLTTESDLFARPERGQVPLITSYEADEEPLAPKNKAEVHAPLKHMFGDF